MGQRAEERDEPWAQRSLIGFNPLLYLANPNLNTLGSKGVWSCRGGGVGWGCGLPQ